MTDKPPATTVSREATQCYHCGLPLPAAPVAGRAGGREQSFCCAACASVARIIHGAGLGRLYERPDWKPSLVRPVVGTAGDGFDAQEVARCMAAGEAEFDLFGIHCPSCSWLIEEYLRRTPGVRDVLVSATTNRALVGFDPARIGPKEIAAQTAAIGYEARLHSPTALQAENERVYRELLYRFATAAFFSMNLMMYSLTLYVGFFEELPARVREFFTWLACAMATPVVFYSGWPFLKGAWRGIKNLHLDMDALVATGSLSAYFFSLYGAAAGQHVYFDTAAMIVALMLVGRLLEHSARRQASFAVERLAAHAPREARVVVNGEERVVPADRVKPGDVLRIRPGEKIPADAVIEEGAAAVDESAITGEWLPREKGPGQRLSAGTINRDGHLAAKALSVGADTALAQIRRLVERALLQKAPIQRIADRTAALFVPLVLATGLATLAAWLLAGDGVGPSLMKAVAVVVIACPCALGLATPAAVMAATARASELGVLFKGGDVIERAARVTVAALDKTGTLTLGRPRVTRCVAAEGQDAAHVLMLAAAAGQNSEHPLARAIVNEAREAGAELPRPQTFKAFRGMGVEAVLDNVPVLVGSAAFLKERGAGVPNIAGDEGETTVYVASGGAGIGVICLADAVRPSAPAAVAELRAMGIGLALVTGDNVKAAERVARELEIGRFRAEMAPQAKAEFVHELRRQGEVVVMLGDGINDAPALGASDVGAAMSDGTDVALETARLTLMGESVCRLPLALSLARKCLRVIRQNLFWAFLYNICGVPLAALGYLNPIYAACAMAASSSIVLGNSMRLKKFSA